MSEILGQPTVPSDKWGGTADNREHPPVISVGATGRLVRLGVVATELGIGDRAAASFLKKIGVQTRTIGRYKYVHLFQLEYALWKWYGLTDDLALLELAWRAYDDMTTRGVIHHLKRLKLGRLGRRLKSRAILWENLMRTSKLEHIAQSRKGRARKPLTYVTRTLEEASMMPWKGEVTDKKVAEFEAVRADIEPD